MTELDDQTITFELCSHTLGVEGVAPVRYCIEANGEKEIRDAESSEVLEKLLQKANKGAMDKWKPDHHFKVIDCWFASRAKRIWDSFNSYCILRLRGGCVEEGSLVGYEADLWLPQIMRTQPFLLLNLPGKMVEQVSDTGEVSVPKGMWLCLINK